MGDEDMKPALQVIVLVSRLFFFSHVIFFVTPLVIYHVQSGSPRPR